MSFATEQVALLKDAYQRVLTGQSIRFGERQLTRADAQWISSELDKWLRRAAAEQQAAAGGQAGVVIADFSGSTACQDFRRDP
jgi:hypothetical protein